MKRARLAFHDFQPELDDFLQDVVQGLSKAQKEVSAKYFYDERGSALFDEICDLPEYYPTRTEIGLLQIYRDELTAVLGKNRLLIEYGSGSARKVSILLTALQEPVAYMPVDISKEYLLHSAAQLAASRSGLEIIAVCADYTTLTQLPQGHKYKDAKKLIFFPGSTIGNYTPMQAIRLLKTAVELLGPGGGMLVGVDLKKDPNILHAAYNDARGVTAAFNLNMLARINRELGADFDLGAFRHQAFYNAQCGRIEMHLLSLKEQTVKVQNYVFRFRKGETIHTENSCKYSIEEFQRIAEAAGFEAVRVWVDEDRLFSLHYLTVP